MKEISVADVYDGVTRVTRTAVYNNVTDLKRVHDHIKEFCLLFVGIKLGKNPISYDVGIYAEIILCIAGELARLRRDNGMLEGSDILSERLVIYRVNEGLAVKVKP